jgi:hypothetical protein
VFRTVAEICGETALATQTEKRVPAATGSWRCGHGWQGIRHWRRLPNPNDYRRIPWFRLRDPARYEEVSFIG